MSNANVAQPATDTNVRLPAAVLEQIKKAEDIAKQVYAPAPDEGDQEASEGQQEASEGQQEGAKPPSQEKTKKEVTPPGNSTEQHLATMTGRYNAAQQQLASVSRELEVATRRVAELERENAALRASVVQPSETDDAVVFSQEEVDEYGPEFLNLVERKAKQVLAPVRAEFERKLTDIQSRVESTNKTLTAKSMQELLDKCAAEIPNFQAMNEDPKFLAWLDLPDPISGAIRRTLLDDAVNKLNPARCIAIFKGFLADGATVDPATKATQVPTEPQKSAKMDLAALAAPGRAKTAQVMDTAEKPIISRSEITQFYIDVANGKYPPEEKARLEAILDSAMKEGRIR